MWLPLALLLATCAPKSMVEARAWPWPAETETSGFSALETAQHALQLPAVAAPVASVDLPPVDRQVLGSSYLPPLALFASSSPTFDQNKQSGAALPADAAQIQDLVLENRSPPLSSRKYHEESSSTANSYDQALLGLSRPNSDYVARSFAPPSQAQAPPPDMSSDSLMPDQEPSPTQPDLTLLREQSSLPQELILPIQDFAAPSQHLNRLFKPRKEESMLDRSDALNSQASAPVPPDQELRLPAADAPSPQELTLPTSFSMSAANPDSPLPWKTPTAFHMGRAPVASADPVPSPSPNPTNPDVPISWKPPPPEMSPDAWKPPPASVEPAALSEPPSAETSEHKDVVVDRLARIRESLAAMHSRQSRFPPTPDSGMDAGSQMQGLSSPLWQQPAPQPSWEQPAPPPFSQQAAPSVTNEMASSGAAAFSSPFGAPIAPVIDEELHLPGENAPPAISSYNPDMPLTWKPPPPQAIPDAVFTEKIPSQAAPVSVSFPNAAVVTENPAPPEASLRTQTEDPVLARLARIKMSMAAMHSRQQRGGGSGSQNAETTFISAPEQTVWQEPAAPPSWQQPPAPSWQLSQPPSPMVQPTPMSSTSATQMASPDVPTAWKPPTPEMAPAPSAFSAPPANPDASLAWKPPSAFGGSNIASTEPRIAGFQRDTDDQSPPPSRPDPVVDRLARIRQSLAAMHSRRARPAQLEGEPSQMDQQASAAWQPPAASPPSVIQPTQQMSATTQTADLTPPLAPSPPFTQFANSDAPIAWKPPAPESTGQFANPGAPVVGQFASPDAPIAWKPPAAESSGPFANPDAPIPWTPPSPSLLDSSNRRQSGSDPAVAHEQAEEQGESPPPSRPDPVLDRLLRVQQRFRAMRHH